jgi:hypothetical protein
MTAITKRLERLTEAEIDDEIVVMLIDKGEFFSLSGTAVAIWRLIDGTRDRPALNRELAAEFEVPEQQVAADVDEFLARLQGLGLIDEG